MARGAWRAWVLTGGPMCPVGRLEVWRQTLSVVPLDIEKVHDGKLEGGGKKEVYIGGEPFECGLAVSIIWYQHRSPSLSPVKTITACGRAVHIHHRETPLPSSVSYRRWPFSANCCDGERNIGMLVLTCGPVCPARKRCGPEAEMWFLSTLRRCLMGGWKREEEEDATGRMADVNCRLSAEYQHRTSSLPPVRSITACSRAVYIRHRETPLPNPVAFRY
ncbi:hypothetical protein K402DRAFT_402662 [Aulographum hederae CBS 113979]|uniref:Uncharacterized protein n=1 Tax=Aulographum hederae CBS 113979 TaxID=1176131 RepID=A0A6G1H5F7_9PEZI|nr:hypothetical protein K402DRAFT_402662 [Aulographum hederae CBS 113979]